MVKKTLQMEKLYETAQSLYAGGKINRALYCYKKILKDDPLCVPALFPITKNHKFSENDTLYKKCRFIYDRQDELKPEMVALIHYIMAKYHDDIDDIDTAFSFYKEGGVRVNQLLGPPEYGKIFKEMRGIFQPGFKIPEAEQEGPVPIFIVGLPRSGSTLLETMIGSHTMAFPMGETSYLLNTVKGVKDYGQALGLENQRYLSSVRQLTDKPYVVDKQLYNFALLPFIRILFPRSPIIHMRRDILDNLFSCFTNFLPKKINEWTNTPEDLVIYYKSYDDLMKYWGDHFSFMEIGYEDLVNDTEKQLRSVLEYCNLPWEDRCLSFYKTKQEVRTASAPQIRKPIYKDSIGRARRYEGYFDLTTTGNN